MVVSDPPKGEHMYYARDITAAVAESVLRWHTAKRKDKDNIKYIRQGLIHTMALDDAIDLLRDAERIAWSQGVFDFDLAVSDSNGNVWQFDIPHPARTWDD